MSVNPLPRFLLMQRFHYPIFMPGEPHDNEIKHRKRDKKQRVRVSVSIHLVCDKKDEDDNRRWIRPQLVAQEPNGQKNLDDAVAQQVERRKRLRVV